MKIVHISSFDFGEAGVSAHRLHRSLIDYGVDSSFLVIQKTKNDPTIKEISTNFKDQTFNYRPDFTDFEKLNVRWYLLYNNKLGKKNNLAFFTDEMAIAVLENNPEIKEADVIHLHWITGMLDLSLIPKLFKNKKIIWTLYDMNPFTGGCHFSNNCEKFNSECGACPQIGSDIFEDISNKLWKYKSAIYQSTSLKIVATNSLIGENILASKLLSGHFSGVINQSVQTDIYKPYPRVVTRGELNIPEDVFVILFTDINSLLKNNKLDDFTRYLKTILMKKNIYLITMGTGIKDLELLSGFKTINYGEIVNENDRAKIYSSSDVLVLLSDDYFLPNNAIESISCGTPVISFERPGINTIIENSKTGFIVKQNDFEQLAGEIKKIILFDKNEEMEDFCREKAIKEFDINIQTKNYLESLYEYNFPEENDFYSFIIDKFKHKNYQPVITKVESLICDGKETYENYLLLAYSLEKTGDFENAEKFYQKCNSFKLSETKTAGEVAITQDSILKDLPGNFLEIDSPISFNFIKTEPLPKISIVTPSFNTDKYVANIIIIIS